MAISQAWLGAVTTTTANIRARSDQASVSATTNPATSTFNGVEGNDSVFAIALTGLTANTAYTVTVDDGTATWVATFTTAPSGAASFTFAAASCCGQNGTGGVADSDAYARIEDRAPAFFIHMGDLHYADISTNDPSLFYAKYQDVLNEPKFASMLQSVPVVYAWDDHDYGDNNSGADNPAKPAAQSSYRDWVPHYTLPDADEIYQTWVYGRVRFIMLDVRSERAGATMLGATQLAWFVDLLETVTEPFTIVVSIVPWIGTNPEGFGGFAAERQTIAEAITDNGWTDNLLMLYGDVHMMGLDNGVNGQFDPAAMANWGPRSACFAPLNATVSLGPDSYSGGRFTGSQEQYGTVEVYDDNSTIDVVLRGWEVDGATESNVTTLRFTAGASSQPTGDDPVKLWTNASVTTVDGNFTVAADPIAVTDGSEWPGSDFTVAVWDASDPKVLKAVIRVGLRTGNSLSALTWNADGHSDVDIADGDIIMLAALAEDFGANYNKVVEDDAPISRLKLDESSGTEAADSSGNANPGVYVNAPTFGVTGPILGDATTATSFNGTDEYVTWDSIAADLAGLTAYTLEGWFLTDDYTESGSGFGRVLFGLNDNAGGNVWKLIINENDAGSNAPGLVALNDGAQVDASSAAFTAGAYHHVACVYSAGLMTVYLDGGAHLADFNATSYAIASTDSISIGQEFDSATPSDFWKGDIGQVAAYDYALTPSQVMTHFIQGRRAGKL